MNYENLNLVRKEMISELEKDIKEGRLYYSERFATDLDESEKQLFQNIMHDAFSKHDDKWLESQIKEKIRMKKKEVTKAGIEKKVPINACQIFAEGVFNSFYIRGLCFYILIKDKNIKLIAYRARESENPRKATEEKIGREFDAEETYNNWIEVSEDKYRKGNVFGYNSGLSLKIKE